LTHYGVARLDIKTDDDKVNGEQSGYYYTDKVRDASGQIIIQKKVK